MMTQVARVTSFFDLSSPLTFAPVLCPAQANFISSLTFLSPVNKIMYVP